MKRNFLCILAVLSACTMLFSACKKTETTSEPTSQPTQQQEEVAEPTPTPEPYEANVLTGEPKGDDYPEGQRITAVMVNNITVARPQRGLSRAQMLFEIKVEGGITRFMPLFNDYKDIEELGPVRSGRDQFFQLILPWQALYIHEGESVFMTQYAKTYEYGNLNNTNGANGYRDYQRVNWQGLSYGNGLALEHTMYTSADNIAEYIQDAGVDMDRTYNSTFFNFVDYRSENPVRDLSASPDSGYSDKYGPVVQDGEYVAITHSASYRTRFLYDAATTTYNMQQYYSNDGSWRDTIDEEYDQQLNFTNLIILYTDFEAYPGDSHDIQDVNFGDGGIGYYCYGGKIEKIYWQKGTPLEALRLYYLTEDGQCSDQQLPVNIGKSYVTIVDVDEAVNLQTGTLADFDLNKSDAATTEQVVDEEAVEAGEGSTDSVSDYVD